MSKHHHQSKAEQIDNKEHGAKTFHNFNDIQVHAYHIHHEKGGSAEENWLEAERTIKNIV